MEESSVAQEENVEDSVWFRSEDRHQFQAILPKLWELARIMNEHGLRGEKIEEIGTLWAGDCNYILIFSFKSEG